MVAFGARTLTALAAPYPAQLHPFVAKVSGDDSTTELFPAGGNDVLLFVKSSTAEHAADATATFLAAAGSVLDSVETTGATRCRIARLVRAERNTLLVADCVCGVCIAMAKQSARTHIMHVS